MLDCFEHNAGHCPALLGRWFWLAAIWAVVLVSSWFPGVIRHARSPIVRACRDPDYSYAHRPCAPSTGGTAEPAPRSRIP